MKQFISNHSEHSEILRQIFIAAIDAIDGNQFCFVDVQPFIVKITLSRCNIIYVLAKRGRIIRKLSIVQCPKTYYTPEEERNIVRSLLMYDPYGSRTRIAAVKGRCPKPLDEGATFLYYFNNRQMSR